MINVLFVCSASTVTTKRYFSHLLENSQYLVYFSIISSVADKLQHNLESSVLRRSVHPFICLALGRMSLKTVLNK